MSAAVLTEAKKPPAGMPEISLEAVIFRVLAFFPVN
jgi:hypothetical protein